MSPRPLLVTAAHDESIRYWDIAEERQLETIIVKDSQINALAVAPTGQYVLAGGYQYVKLFDAVHQSNSQALQTYTVHDKNVTSLGFSADGGWIFTGSDDGTARIWDRRSPKLSCICAFALNVAINSVVMHPNQREFLIADAAGGVYIWDITNNKSDSLPLELCQNEFVTCVDVDAAGKQISAITNRGKAFLYNCSSKIVQEDKKDHPLVSLVFPFAAHLNYGLRCRFSPDGKWLVTTAGDDLPRLWDVSEASRDEPILKLKRTFQGDQLPNRLFEQNSWIWDVAFTNDSTKVIVPGADRVIRLFDVESGHETRHCIGHGKGITAMAFWDPSGRQR